MEYLYIVHVRNNHKFLNIPILQNYDHYIMELENYIELKLLNSIGVKIYNGLYNG